MSGLIGCCTITLKDCYTTHSWNTEYSVHIWLPCTVFLKAASSLWKYVYKFFKSHCTLLLLSSILCILDDLCFFFGLHKLSFLVANITLDNWVLISLSVEVKCPCFSTLFHLFFISISCCLQKMLNGKKPQDNGVDVQVWSACLFWLLICIMQGLFFLIPSVRAP